MLISTEMSAGRHIIFAATYRARIFHRQWPLQRAEAEFERNTMTGPVSLQMPAVKPLLHFAKILEVLVWMPERAA